MVKHKASSILKGSIENIDDDFKYNIGKASVVAPPVPRKYKHIKDEKKTGIGMFYWQLKI